MAAVWRSDDQACAGTASVPRSPSDSNAGLRRAVARSQRRLPDGSLFVPVRLLDDEQPYDVVVEARLGSYWNLVAPYALASGLFPPAARRRRAPCATWSGTAAAARPRARGRLRALRTRCLPGLGHEPGLQHERRALPRRQRRGRRPRSQPLRLARSRNDPGNVRRRRGGERRAAPRNAVPRDVPATEQRRKHRIPGDTAYATRPRDPFDDGSANWAPARVLDAAWVAPAGQADRAHGAPTSFGPVSFSITSASSSALRDDRRSPSDFLRSSAFGCGFPAGCGSSARGSTGALLEDQSEDGDDRSLGTRR